MLQQELDHINLSEMTSDMKRGIASLSLRVNGSAGLDEDSSAVDLVLLGAQMKGSESVARGGRGVGRVVE